MLYWFLAFFGQFSHVEFVMLDIDAIYMFKRFPIILKTNVPNFKKK